LVRSAKQSSSAGDDGGLPAAKAEVGKKRKFSEMNSSTPIGNGNASSQKGKNEPFRRVRAEEIEIKKVELKDNSYKSFDTWGEKANKDLVSVL
jgi:SRP40, C-terminal domain